MPAVIPQSKQILYGAYIVANEYQFKIATSKKPIVNPITNGMCVLIFIYPTLLFNRYLMIHVPFKCIVMRDHKKLFEVPDLPDLLSKIFAAFAVHICRRLVEECDADVRQLL